MPACKVCGSWFVKIKPHEELCDKCECTLCRLSGYVAPVRHGRWVQVIVHVEFEDGFVDRVEEYCSACNEPNESRCTYFCPNCGAKMDGGED